MAVAGTGSPVNGFAGNFHGDVVVTGNLHVQGTKNFVIDHPFDPANKYLYHAAIESSEVLNIYSGNVTLDANGKLQSTFHGGSKPSTGTSGINSLVSAASPRSEKVHNNRFKIAGGRSGMQVSWQVTGIRNDAWEKLHPMQVEVAKPRRERGFYLAPERYGAPEEKQIEWARRPQLMKQMKEQSMPASALVRPAAAVVVSPGTTTKAK